MKTESASTLIAVVGGSGAGKSWLAGHLHREFPDEAATLSLDDFYCDLSHLVPAKRARVNFDHPNAIDWAVFKDVLRRLKNGETVGAPRYSFLSHTRLSEWEPRGPKPFLFVEGLWLLWAPRVRELFDFRIFLDCPEPLRGRRRLARDLHERGRTAESTRDRFWKVVAPMHQRFVQVQKVWADLVLKQPAGQAALRRLTATIRALRSPPTPTTSRTINPRDPVPQFAALQII